MIFDEVRMNKKGGGVAVSAKPELNPGLVSEVKGDIVAVTVDINTNTSISCTSAYGPQAKATTDAKTDFWSYLSNGASSARNAGKGFILQGDLNATLGPCIVPGDLNQKNENGKPFEFFFFTKQSYSSEFLIPV